MKQLLVLLLALALSACGTMLRARVSSFHNLPPEKAGITFAVLPFEWQNGSFEFQTYEQRVVADLKSKGFEPVPLEQAQYVVFLAYAIDSGQLELLLPDLWTNGCFFCKYIRHCKQLRQQSNLFGHHDVHSNLWRCWLRRWYAHRIQKGGSA